MIGSGATRAEAIARLDAALGAIELELVGPKGPRTTNLAFLRAVLASPEFASGAYDTSLADVVLKRSKNH